MDYSSVVVETIQYFFLRLLVPIGLLSLLFRSAWFKGWIGEVLVSLAARVRLPESSYHRLHNVTLPTPDGTTQIDHIFVSRFGVFVLETKNMRGWILGGENQAQWTQKIYKASYKFQNPLRQNYKHVKALESILDIPPEAIHSVVVFVGNSRFKTPMPANVTLGGGYVRYIKSFRKPVLSEAQVQAVLSCIAAGRLAPGRATDRQHIQRLKSRAAPSSSGARMVLRTARRGAKAGQQFWGCSTYPRCRAVENIT